MRKKERKKTYANCPYKKDSKSISAPACRYLTIRIIP